MQSYKDIEIFKLRQISKEKRGGYKHNQTAIFCILLMTFFFLMNLKYNVILWP